MTIVIVLAAYITALVFDFVPTFKTKKPRFVWPCLVILGLGAAVQILYEMKVNVPGPTVAITGLVSSLFNIK